MSLPTKCFVAIIGPTASGKSKLAIAISEALSGEIVSCDSVQIYRGFDIGTAKPSKTDQMKICHHLIDIVGPGSGYDAHKYKEKAREVVFKTLARKKIPIVVGGSGLYFRSFMGENFHKLPTDANLRNQLRSENTIDLYNQMSIKIDSFGYVKDLQNKVI